MLVFNYGFNCLFQIVTIILLFYNIDVIKMTTTTSSDNNVCDNLVTVLRNITHARKLFSDMNANELANVFATYRAHSVDELVNTLYELAVNNSEHFNCDDSTAEETKQPSTIHYPMTLWLRLYLPPIIIVIGTVGNLLSLLILRQKVMRAISTYFYLTVGVSRAVLLYYYHEGHFALL